MRQVHKKRQDRLKERAIGENIDMIMVCDPVNLLYFTGVKITPYERFIALLMDTKTGKTGLILPSLERDAAKDSNVNVEFYSDQDDPFTAVPAFSGSSGKTGVEKKSLPLAVGEALHQVVSHRTGSNMTELSDIGSIIMDIRLIKDDTELTNHRIAAQCSDDILAEISTGLFIGQTEKAIMLNILQSMAAKPNVLVHDYVIQILAGIGSADPHGYAGDRTLKPGDPVTIDFGVCYDHYWSDICRTFFMGPPEPKLKEIYSIVLDAQLAAIDKIRPGTPMSEVDLTARNMIEKAGYGNYFIHRTGHGIGLDIHEPPSIHRLNHTLLCEGMIFTIEPGIYIPGLGGVRIEEDVVVTATGCEVLTHTPKSFADMVL